MKVSSPSAYQSSEHLLSVRHLSVFNFLLVAIIFFAVVLHNPQYLAYINLALTLQWFHKTDIFHHAKEMFNER